MGYIRVVLDVIEKTLYTWISFIASFTNAPDRVIDHPMMIEI